MHQKSKNGLKNPTIGILGDGQLARMLAQAAQSLRFTPIICTTNPESPAAQVGSRIASPSHFFKQTSLVAFESEFVKTDDFFIKKNQQKFLPSLSTMEQLQNKLFQKNILEKLKIPTARFQLFNPEKLDLNDWLDLCIHKKTTVLKWATMGYDGKGTFFLNRHNTKKAFEFCQTAIRKNISIYAEEKIQFKTEAAIIGCFSVSGQFKSYPLVLTQQIDGVCRKVWGPAIQYKTPKKLEQKAQTFAEKLSRKINLFGCFGIEFFITKKNELLVNEIAPRVHNSGHYTMDCFVTSQFENHWRALLAMPLGDTKPKHHFIMLNLLTPKNGTVKLNKFTNAIAKNPLIKSKKVLASIHWYGKTVFSPKRKLGHVNLISLEKKQLKQLWNLGNKISALWEK